MLLTSNLDPTPFTDLGIAGAALFIVLVLVLSMFASQKRSIDKLCDKIDSVVTSFSENNAKLTEVIVSNDKDQKQLLLYMEGMNRDIKDIQRRVTRIDTRIYDKFKDTPDGPVMYVSKERKE